ncbi:MAG: hypothetical protein AAF086_05935 [Planctomycetota bacterium]
MSEHDGSLSRVRWKQLDGVLRGDATRAEALEGGEVPVSAKALLPALLGLGVVYGLCMGSFGLIRAYTGTGLGDHARDTVVSDAWWQLLSTMVKVPVLFAATLVVTLPSLYVFNALVGSRLSGRSVLRLLVAMLGVTLAVLASLGPIVAFFGVSTTSYPFMKLLNVVCFTVAGTLGLAFLLRTLRLLVRTAETVVIKSEDGEASETLVMKHDRAKNVFRIWIVVFALVGAQMSWVLRPFIGDPELEFAWFRSRESNFFLDVFEAALRLLGVQ